MFLTALFIEMCIRDRVNGDTITVGLANDLEVDNVDVNNTVTAKRCV